MITEVVLVVFLALLNGFFALSEMALMTSRKLRLKQLAQTSRRAQVALELAQQPEKFLSTVQVFITLLGIGTGTALGATIGAEIARWLNALDLPGLAQYALPLGVALSISGITFVNMLLGELIPKRLALVAPEKFATSVAIPMRALTWLALPFAFSLSWITRKLLQLFRVGQASEARVSEEEIRLLVSEGAEQGVIDSDEHNMVNRVLRLGDRSVDSLMTPRPRIAWLDVTAPLAENLAVMRESSHSRYPVYRGSDQDVLGILEVKNLIEVLELRQGGEPKFDLFRTLAKPVYVPGAARALDLLEDLRDAATPMAFIVDEYGDIEGLVTLNDLLGAVVGKAALPAIEARPGDDAPIVTRDDGSWLIDGALGIDDLHELTGIVTLPHEKDDDYRTAAGMVIAQFGRIPACAEHFDWSGFRFEVVDLDGARIDKILISRLGEATASADETG
ncbi:MAG: HlyC/CorC family transporter [Rudaea sp.]|uniref:hemolysin family protein n=1 Tax=unclassified Rudaea TaxID=2627037 RepID=UPI0010F8367E|nr:MULTISPECIES: hemolysin family protein [unclassified Rudaea]MBN8886656.1 HlyC/CorC family transporter [Rudaea sp.]MBR0345653.1 HlyC/CorC family transporter [Rudaea sp.]